jgi:ubiquitin carboxyl-terminal hydrolase 36/42
MLPSGFNSLDFGRSYPRPTVEFTGKAAPQSVSDLSKHLPLEMQKPSKPGHSRHVSQSFVSEPSHNARPEIPTHLIDTSNGFLKRSTNRNVHPVIQTYAENFRHEFSDATSSDWSIFTSSDEASFTTESTRDSFSTVDYCDSSSNMDPISSLFNYTPENNYMKISHSRPLTRFLPKKGHIERVQKTTISES